jgi:hypothetical protein
MTIYLYSILLLTVLFYSCVPGKQKDAQVRNTGNHKKSELDDGIAKYDRLLLRGNIDSLLSLFTADVQYGDDPGEGDLRGRFEYVTTAHKILYCHSSSDTVTIDGNTSIQKGTFEETVIHPGNHKVNFTINYTAQWVWFADKGWLIRKYNWTKKSRRLL